MKFACEWVELEKILSEVTHDEKDKHGMFSLGQGHINLPQRQK